MLTWMLLGALGALALLGFAAAVKSVFFRPAHTSRVDGVNFDAYKDREIHRRGHYHKIVK